MRVCVSKVVCVCVCVRWRCACLYLYTRPIRSLHPAFTAALQVKGHNRDGSYSITWLSTKKDEARAVPAKLVRLMKFSRGNRRRGA